MSQTDKDILRVVGLMSGTSVDGIDAALLETDGGRVIRMGRFLSVPYDDAFRGRIRALFGTTGDTPQAEEVSRELAQRHAYAVQALLDQEGLIAGDIDLIGFHGQTILHDPPNRVTRQLGDGALLARLTGIRVVNDFRTADVLAGGQGAPLVPICHDALAANMPRPLATLNIGGVANLAYLSDGDPVGCDTGPGNALIDDLLLRRTGTPLDEDGRVALAGKVDPVVLARLLDHPYFTRPAPKSLDRNAFDASLVDGLSLPDAAATLVRFTAEAVGLAARHLPILPRRWLVCGGGRHNPAIMAALREVLGVPVDAVEAVGWNGDALEAQAFGYLAVRVLKGLPISFPSVSGVPEPLTGGVLHAA